MIVNCPLPDGRRRRFGRVGVAAGVASAQPDDGGRGHEEAAREQRRVKARGERGGQGSAGREHAAGAGGRDGGQDGEPERAPPTCCEALSSAAARPARSAGTPALAAVATATNTAPRPNEKIIRPGPRSVREEPCTGTRGRSYTPPAEITEPATHMGRGPVVDRIWRQMPAETRTTPR